MSWTPMRHLARAVTWKPVAVTSACSVVWFATAPSVSDLLVSVTTAVVGASTAYVIEDPAAGTLATTPTTLRYRRAQRVAATVLLVSAWWAVAVAIITVRTVETSIAFHSLRLGAFVAIALATSSWNERVGRGGNSGTAGAVAVLAALGSSYLPERWLHAVPPDPVDAAALRHLVVIALVALALVSRASSDPAGRPLWAVDRQRRGRSGTRQRRIVHPGVGDAPRVVTGGDQAKTSTES